MIGDRRKYLTALIGIELDTVGDWATRQRHRRSPPTRDLATKPEVRELIGDVGRRRSTPSWPRSRQVKRFALLPKELDHEEGELTATQKVKRAAIAREFERPHRERCTG